MPSTVLTTIGKKLIKATTIILGANPYPIQTNNIGAITIIGTVWEAIINGYKAFSTVCERQIAEAKMTPTTKAKKNPKIISSRVTTVCLKSIP